MIKSQQINLYPAPTHQQLLDVMPLAMLQEDDMPQYKMMMKGPAALSNAEILSIIIGGKPVQALSIARQLLSKVDNNLSDLGRLSITEMRKDIEGLGEAKAAQIAAAMEFGRRRQSADVLSRPAITSMEDAAEVIMPMLNDRNTEAFVVVYLNQANRLMKVSMVSEGGITGTVADIRVILREALAIGSNQLIVAHNHPSGNLNPSTADRTLTTKLKESCSLMDIRLLDHLIIAGGRYLSLQEEGMMA